MKNACNNAPPLPAPSDVVLGIDLGTTYFKVGLFDAAGRLRGLGRVPTPSESPGPGQCEMHPEAFDAALVSGLNAALSEGGVCPGHVRGIAYSSQANSFLLLDPAGRPLTPLLLWPDTRAGVHPELAALWSRPDFAGRTGIGVAMGPGTALNKALALRRTLPVRQRQSFRFVTISDYLVYRLTGVFNGDGGTASLLGLEALPECCWWADALEALGLETGQLGRLLRPGTAAGSLSPEAADRFGLPPGIPVAVGSLDHHMAALGAGLGTVAALSESSGTVMACLRRTAQFAPRAGCCIGPDAGPGFFELAWDGNGGAVLEWYHRTIAGGIALDALDREAAAVPPGSNGLRAKPRAHLLGHEAAFTGRQPLHGRGHEMRALLESVTRSLCEKIDVLCGSALPDGVIATGGGARSPVWMQLKADMLGASFYVPDCPEPACRGAALLAAVAAGWFASPADAGDAWRPQFRRYDPQPDVHRAYREWRAVR